MTPRALIDQALEARSNAYAPYSGFAVGAALLCADGRVFLGCNVENASSPAAMCAERVAFGAALAAGYREFSAIAVVGGPQGDPAGRPCFPCGVCRQVMREFCGDDFQAFLLEQDKVQQYTLAELMPYSFILEENGHAHD